MNSRRNGNLKPLKAKSKSARSHITATLAQEILLNGELNDFRMASEYELCERFNVSRVTVRLALSELENRKLIYRRHGKGTYAFGCAMRMHKNIAVLIKASVPSELKEILEGAASVVLSLDATIMLLKLPPETWPVKLVNELAGVIVVAENVTATDLDHLKNRKLPFFIVGETDLSGPRLPTAENHWLSGKYAAEALNRMALIGEGESISEVLHRFALNLELIPTDSNFDSFASSSADI